MFLVEQYQTVIKYVVQTERLNGADSDMALAFIYKLI